MNDVYIARRSPCANTITRDDLANIAWASDRPQEPSSRPYRKPIPYESDRLASAPCLEGSVRDHAPHRGSRADLVDAMKAIIESSVAG